MGIRARQAQRLLAEGSRVAVTTPHQPVGAERGHHREGAFSARLADRPPQCSVEVLDLCVELREALGAAGARKCSLASEALGAREVVLVVAFTDGLLVTRD